MRKTNSRPPPCQSQSIAGSSNSARYSSCVASSSGFRTPAELEHPAVQRHAKLRFDPERRAGLEHRLETGPQGLRRRERQNVAGREQAAVALRAAATDIALVDDRDVEAVPLEVVRTGDADMAGADDDGGVVSLVHRFSVSSLLWS